MELTVREAAVLLGRSPRAVRAQLQRGTLPGRKVGGCWRLRRDELPLTEAQRQRLQARAQAIRQSVESVLPSRQAATRGQRSRSIADLDGFRLLLELRNEIASNAAGSSAALPAAVSRRIVGGLQRSLRFVAEAVLHFRAPDKLAAVAGARRELASVVTLLFVESGLAPSEPMFAWIHRLEQEALPALAGFARWIDKLESSA